MDVPYSEGSGILSSAATGRDACSRWARANDCQGEVPAFTGIGTEHFNDLKNHFPHNNLVTELKHITLEYIEIIDKKSVIGKSFVKGVSVIVHICSLVPSSGVLVAENPVPL